MAEQWASKDALFKAPVKKQRHSIDGFGDVWIHGLTCGEKDEYEAESVKILSGSREVRLENARALLLLWTVYDQHGKRLFAAKDIGRIKQLPAHISEPMYLIARRLSHMTAEDVEELVKNSAAIQSGDSAIE